MSAPKNDDEFSPATSEHAAIYAGQRKYVAVDAPEAMAAAGYYKVETKKLEDEPFDEFSAGHPRHEGQTRDEFELFLRDAYAAGCNAAANRSLYTAMEYASREAPKLRALIIPQTATDAFAAERDALQARVSELEAFVDEIVTATPVIRHARHTRHPADQMPDMIEYDWFEALQDDAKALAAKETGQ